MFCSKRNKLGDSFHQTQSCLEGLKRLVLT